MTVTSSNKWVIKQDFACIGEQAKLSFHQLKGGHIFLTGGTGFIGTWILEAIRFVNESQGANIQVTILTRNPENFHLKYPHLFEHSNFHYLAGDVVGLPYEKLVSIGKFTHLIHAATDASAELNEVNPLQMFDTVVLGTRQILDFAVKEKISKVLYLSSGAVYGQQAPGVDFVAEDAMSAPNCLNPKNTYAEGKRASEMLCAIYGKQFGCHIVVARIFALLGPLLNLDIHFAAGNFIRDAISGKKISVSGDGRPERSYLYPSDLVVWLLAMLTHGKSGAAYNAGSEEGISIADLAKLTSSLIGNQGYEILRLTDSGWNPGRYVPSSQLIQKQLGVMQTVNLAEAIKRTAYWNGWREV
jgi:nucleoside-diphosphate-sugar epimerase